jgi:hypothetical protein
MMVRDFFMVRFDGEHEAAVWDIEAVARLSNERILFAIRARVAYPD